MQNNRLNDENVSVDFDYIGPPVGVLLTPCEGEMRVPDNALKHVVYLGSGDSSATFRAIGTGFLIDHNRIPGGVYYLITADHVARKLKPQFAIRFNDRQGRSHVQQSQKSFRWWHHPSDKSVDAAVFPWGLKGDFATFPMNSFLTYDMESTRIGIGDEVFIVGLFRRWAGKDRVTPIVRHGHIAMMANESIPTKNYGPAYMHLVEAFSLAGMSGSPVVVRQTMSIPLVPTNRLEPRTGMLLGDMYLLGLVHGYYPVSEMGPDKEVWHSGISMVVPSTKLLEILNQEELIEYEKQVMMEVDEPVEAALNESTQMSAPQKGDPVEIPIPARDQFLGDLAKATRRKKPSE